MRDRHGPGWRGLCGRLSFSRRGRCRSCRRLGGGWLGGRSRSVLCCLFFQDISALLILHNRWQRSTCGLQERGEFHLSEPLLLEGIAHVAVRRPHVERAARLTLEEHVVASEMNLCRLAACPQLLQMSVAELALLVL